MYTGSYHSAFNACVFLQGGVTNDYRVVNIFYIYQMIKTKHTCPYGYQNELKSTFKPDQSL